METIQYLDKKGLNTLIELIVNDTPSIDVPIHEDGDDIKILNALTDFEFSSPLSDVDGDLLIDIDGSILAV